MSNKASIEKSLKGLILDDNNEFVAMLSGEWGIGKTHFWNNLFAEKELKKSNIAYISLFGYSSLQSIKNDIIMKLSNTEKGKAVISEIFNNFRTSLGSREGDESSGLSLGGNLVSSALSAIPEKSLVGTVICFDDFERLSHKVSLKDVMGLISQFKEQKKCKVVMILNEGELSEDDQKVFAEGKEKIVDYSFNYKPSQEELFEAIKEDIKKIKFCKNEWIYDFFKKINLNNIRIMKQAIYQLGHFSFIEEGKFNDKVVKEFVEIALNLFVFKARCNYNYKEFSKIKSYKTKKMWAKVIDSSEDVEYEINEKYEKCLNCCNPDEYIFTNEYSKNKNLIEKNIYGFIDNHLINKDELLDFLKENNKSLSRYDIRNEISEVNKRLFTDFSVPNNEIANQLFILLEEHKDDMCYLFHYKDFKPLIEHINKFLPQQPTNELEVEIVKNYISFYDADPVHDEALDGTYSELINNDYEWADEYRKEHRKTLKVESSDISSIMEVALKNRHCPHDDAYKLSSISSEEYKELIKTTPDFIQTLVDFLRNNRHDTNLKEAIENISNALISLKNESEEYAWKIDYIARNANIKLEDE